MNHDNSTASVYVSGVALGCINSRTKKWEVGFVREPYHELWVDIIKRKQGEADTVWCRPQLINPARIVIEAASPVHKDSKIASLSGSDSERFKLLIDIEKDVYRGDKIKRKRPANYKVSEMYVSNARLYSVEKREPPSVWIVKDNDPHDRRKRERIGTTAGADIECNEGGYVRVSVDGAGGFETDLCQEEGTRYIVHFDNRCPSAKALDDNTRSADSSAELTLTLDDRGYKTQVTDHSDFTLFYDLLNPENKGTYDLEMITTKGEGAVCNYSNLGNADWMFPLPIT